MNCKLWLAHSLELGIAPIILLLSALPIGEHPHSHQVNFVRFDHCLTTAIMPGTAGVWFRKCLRLHDNEALVKAGLPVENRWSSHWGIYRKIPHLVDAHDCLEMPKFCGQKGLLGKAANFRHSVQQCQRHFICYMWLIDSDTDNFERFLVLLSGPNGHLRDCTLCSHLKSCCSDLMFPWLRTGHDQCHPQNPWFFPRCCMLLLVGSHVREGGSFLHPGPTLCGPRRCEQVPLCCCMLLYVVAAWCHPCTEVQLFAAEFAGQKPRVPTSCSSVFWVKFSETMRHPIVKYLDEFMFRLD